MLNFLPAPILPQRKYSLSLWKLATILNSCTMKPVCILISSRMSHCYWTWTDGSIHFLSALCPIYLLWGFDIQFVMQMFDTELQVLFSWLNSKDTAGILYVMMCFWSPITGNAAKILGLMRRLFLFRNLNTKSPFFGSEYRPLFLYACFLPHPFHTGFSYV